ICAPWAAASARDCLILSRPSSIEDAMHGDARAIIIGALRTVTTEIRIRSHRGLVAHLAQHMGFLASVCATLRGHCDESPRASSPGADKTGSPAHCRWW